MYQKFRRLNWSNIFYDKLHCHLLWPKGDRESQPVATTALLFQSQSRAWYSNLPWMGLEIVIWIFNVNTLDNLRRAHIHPARIHTSTKQSPIMLI